MAGKAKEGELLVNSREYDSRAYDLFIALDKCSEEHKEGCYECPLAAECLRVWDALCNKRTHRKLTDKNIEAFETKFRNFHKQLSMV